ncbi:MFS transporter [Geodermatophilus sabuli]|uniref:MFS transporter n=1 Tax=Geodermatophilus sabuli TaxID=1564158 RepID=A0A7K3W2M6_9ACTN|nr:MFS transporter [Geodermatophilus sabuli]
MTGSDRPRSWDLTASATTAVIHGLALGTASVALPLLALGAGYSAAEIGALTAVSAVSQLASRLSLGALMRRVPEWTLVTASGLFLALSCGVVALSSALAPFVLAQLLQGFSRAFFWTASTAHLVRGPGRAAPRLAVINLAASVGSLTGPVLAGLLSERTPVLALTVAAAIAVAGVAPTFLLDRLPPFAPPADRVSGRLWRRPGVDVGCCAGLTAGGWQALLVSYVPVGLVASGQSASAVGALVAVANGAMLVGSGFAGRVSSRWAPAVVLAGILLGGLAVALSAAVAWSTPLSVVVLAAGGSAAGVLQVLGSAVVAESVHPEERGEAVATSGTFRAIAMLAAPLAVAGLISAIPLTPALVVVGTALGLPAVVLRRHARPGPATG